MESSCMADEITYRAYELTSHGEDLREVTKQLKLSLTPKEVVVKTRAAGVCHTDVHLWHGNYQIGRSKDQVVTFAERGVSLPRVPGHEIAGDVFALGEEAKKQSGLSVGDRVLLFPWVGCDGCEVCEGGDPASCSVRSQELGFVCDGGYSEFVRISNYRYVFKISDVPYETAALLPCSALTAYNSVRRISSVIEHVTGRWKQTANVGVIGLGGLGQWAVGLLRYVYGKIHIIGIDIAESKIAHVSKKGLVDGTFTLDVNMSVEEQTEAFLKKFSHLNCVLDFVNTTDTFQLSIHLLHNNGILVCTGLHGGVGELQLPFFALKSLTITGICTGSPDLMKELLDYMKRTPLSPPQFTRYPLHKATQALHDLENGKLLGKAILIPDHD